MTFTKIEKEWNMKFLALANEAEKKCRKRLVEIVKKLRFITITKIIMGMGSWVIYGSDFKIIYEDGSEGTTDIQEIIYWVEGYLGYTNGKVWKPKDITKSEIAVVVELSKICEWLVKNTGGCDIEFTNA